MENPSEHKLIHGDGREESLALQSELLGSISKERKDAVIDVADRIVTSQAEELWKGYGHNIKWINETTIQTNRTVNDPEDRSFYARKDAQCVNCTYNMWITVGSHDVTIHGGMFSCEEETKRTDKNLVNGHRL